VARSRFCPAVPVTGDAWAVQSPMSGHWRRNNNDIEATGFGFDLDQPIGPLSAKSGHMQCLGFNADLQLAKRIETTRRRVYCPTRR
jgi:hypothetical protein